MKPRLRLEEFRTTQGAAALRIVMTAPRANALEPGLLDDLSAAFDQAERIDAKIVLLCGGRNFSSGGDVGGFRQAALSGQATAYANRVVPVLQNLVSRMIAMPRLVAVAARGAITGGSAGFLFAADLAVLAPDAFVQPYYSRVGFAPDGGWTALLPERIGAGRALEWLQSDRRLGAREICNAGLASLVSETPEEAALEHLEKANLGTMLATKALVWDASRRAGINQRLAAETAAFAERIAQPDTASGMARFLQGVGARADV